MLCQSVRVMMRKYTIYALLVVLNHKYIQSTPACYSTVQYMCYCIYDTVACAIISEGKMH